ncbi:MAG: PAS domain-containing sensor histidine kinase [Bifidobacteriaceae bacterium]|nr:PAS domain-containing sensor histidine kinase [Bifidobacteriaceae bacterium]MCI1978233.1 PAS domain-containing sensor histidine kinase [Bifidobacteriaceae bacterium]
MTDFAKIIADAPGLNATDREWLHHLVADWQVIADLGYADLLLAIPVSDGQFIYAGQCRPSTVLSVRPDDLVGHLADDKIRPLLIKAMGTRDVVRSESIRKIDDYTICDVATCVWYAGRPIAVVIRETNLSTRAATGRYESESIKASKRLFSMISRSEFPYKDSVLSQRHNARVPDGFIVLSADGSVEYASPNAVSCFKRIGNNSEMEGTNLIELGVGLLHKADPVPEQLPLVLSGKAPVDSDIEASGGAISVRSLPLSDENGHCGAVILCRDVTELRRRDQQLKTKDATIAEIHHRVKNNLQSVSALLRLQSRRTDDPEVKKALGEAMRRVETIAVVHEGLSQTADEVVDFDSVISNLLRMSVDLASIDGQHIGISYMGSFGMMPAQDATPLSLVLTELVTNAVEHGFEGMTEGHIVISVGRGGNNLNVVVEDDGRGLDDDPKHAQARTHGTGLGTQIINTFVQSDFGGTVRWEPRREGGTRVVLNIKLRAAQAEN